MDIYNEILDANTKTQLNNLKKNILNNDQLDYKNKEFLIEQIYTRLISYIAKNPKELHEIFAEIVAEANLNNDQKKSLEKIYFYKLLDISTTKEEINTLKKIVPFNQLDKENFIYQAYQKLIHHILNDPEELNNIFIEIMAEENLSYDQKIFLIFNCLNKLIKIPITKDHLNIFKENIITNDQLDNDNKKIFLKEIYIRSILYIAKNLEELKVIFTEIEIDEKKILTTETKEILLQLNFEKSIRFAKTEQELANLYNQIITNQILNLNSCVLSIYEKLIDLSSFKQLMNFEEDIISNTFLYLGNKNYLLRKALETSIFVAETTEELEIVQQKLASISILDSEDKAKLVQLCEEKLAEITQPEQAAFVATRTVLSSAEEVKLLASLINNTLELNL